MSERNRYPVTVSREFLVWADDPREAEAVALEQEQNHPVVICEALPAPYSEREQTARAADARIKDRAS